MIREAMDCVVGYISSIVYLLTALRTSSFQRRSLKLAASVLELNLRSELKNSWGLPPHCEIRF